MSVPSFYPAALKTHLVRTPGWPARSLPGVHTPISCNRFCSRSRRSGVLPPGDTDRGHEYLEARGVGSERAFAAKKCRCRSASRMESVGAIMGDGFVIRPVCSTSGGHFYSAVGASSGRRRLLTNCGRSTMRCVRVCV